VHAAGRSWWVAARLESLRRFGQARRRRRLGTAALSAISRRKNGIDRREFCGMLPVIVNNLKEVI
jgi:hypothetical protein